MKKIVLVLKGSIENLPPFMTLAIELSQMKYHIVLLTSVCNESTKILLKEYNIEIVILGDDNPSKNKIGKLVQWLSFRKKTLTLIDQMNFDYLWIGSADTAIALGNKILKYKYILSLYELYDKFPVYRYLLKKPIDATSCLVVPESNRAAIFRYWYNLQYTPIVIPNKPYNTHKDIEVNKKVQNLFPSNKKIALYQGHIGEDRYLTPVCQAFNEVSDSWQLVLMGMDHGYLDQLRSICPSLLHIENIDAPKHLGVTKLAHIGLVSYTYRDLNNVFCAPNKIWEYSAFQKPMLGNNVPGLLNTIERFDAGICVDYSNHKEILNAISIIENNYDKYVIGSKKLNSSVTVKDMIVKVLSK